MTAPCPPHIDPPQHLVSYFRSRILAWAARNSSGFPWRKTENKWHALVAEIMLQRTRAQQVLPVYESFSAQYGSPADFLADETDTTFASLGLSWRERELRKLAVILSQQPIPLTRQELLELPGVGDYISSAFLSLHSGKRDFIIDSNVVRLYGRFFGFDTDAETRRKKWFIELADRLTPIRKFRDFNYGLIDFTRTVCKPKPLCRQCVLRTKCHYPQRAAHNFKNQSRQARHTPVTKPPQETGQPPEAKPDTVI